MYERMITERPFMALKDICGQFDLGPPGPDELDEIVHRSAEAAGLQYEERGERLDDRLLRDAAGENTLPLLQFALDLLFEKCWVGRGSKVLTHDAYEEIGGLDERHQSDGRNRIGPTRSAWHRHPLSAGKGGRKRDSGGD